MTVLVPAKVLARKGRFAGPPYPVIIAAVSGPRCGPGVHRSTAPMRTQPELHFNVSLANEWQERAVHVVFARYGGPSFGASRVGFDAF